MKSLMNKYRTFSSHDLNFMQLNNLCRFRQKTIQAKTKVKIQLVTYVDLLSYKIAVMHPTLFIKKYCWACRY